MYSSSSFVKTFSACFSDYVYACVRAAYIIYTDAHTFCATVAACDGMQETGTVKDR